MLRVLVVALLLVAWVCGEVAANYKAGEDGNMPKRAIPYEQEMPKRRQTYLESIVRRAAVRRKRPSSTTPPKIYHQCYFNPVSCFPLDQGNY